MASNIIKVSELNTVIHNIFVAEEMLHGIVICGEVSGFKISRNHAYFALKDELAAISVNDFNYASKYVPKEGEQILVKGSVDYYAPTGKLSFNATSIQPYGAGALAALFEKLKKELAEKGYFDDTHKKPIPKYPKRVCVITSKTGAVIRDIITTTRRYNNVIDLVVRDCKVQGLGAEDELVQAIKEVDELNFDAIIIARGGGSLEDLMPFNSEKLVYAIYDAKTPIISAVGHETDFTLCDFVADVRCATPTAGAELIAYSVEDVKQFLKDSEQRLFKALNLKMDNSLNKLVLLQGRLKASLDTIYSKNRSKLELLLAKISLLAENSLKNKELEFHKLSVRLDANNPSKIFTKGYVYAKDTKGNSIKSVSDLKVGEDIKLITDGGSAIANIKEVNHEI